jgi:hypothetical protein
MVRVVSSISCECKIGEGSDDEGGYISALTEKKDV